MQQFANSPLYVRRRMQMAKTSDHSNLVIDCGKDGSQSRLERLKRKQYTDDDIQVMRELDLRLGAQDRYMELLLQKKARVDGTYLSTCLVSVTSVDSPMSSTLSNSPSPSNDWTQHVQAQTRFGPNTSPSKCLQTLALSAAVPGVYPSERRQSSYPDLSSCRGTPPEFSHVQDTRASQPEGIQNIQNGSNNLLPTDFEPPNTTPTQAGGWTSHNSWKQNYDNTNNMQSNTLKWPACQTTDDHDTDSTGTTEPPSIPQNRAHGFDTGDNRSTRATESINLTKSVSPQEKPRPNSQWYVNQSKHHPDDPQTLNDLAKLVQSHRSTPKFAQAQPNNLGWKLSSEGKWIGTTSSGGKRVEI